MADEQSGEEGNVHCQHAVHVGLALYKITPIKLLLITNNR